MEQRWQDDRSRFAENVIKKYGHKNLPFLDDPYHSVPVRSEEPPDD